MKGYRTGLVVGMVAVGLVGGGCESEEENYQLQVVNQTAEPVLVFLNGDQIREVAPESSTQVRLANTRYTVRLERPNGSVLLEQNIDIDGGIFVRYIVAPDGSVTATGNALNDGSSPDFGAREVRVANNSPAAVLVYIDDALQTDVAAGRERTLGVSQGPHRVSLRSLDEQVLFEQNINLAKGTYARYNIAPDGTITASGGAT